MGTQAVGHPYDLFLGRFKPKKDTFGDFADIYFHGSWEKYETWYNYGLRIAYKNTKGTHIVGHYSDLFLGHLKPKLVKNGQSWGTLLIKHPLLSG